MRFLFDYKPECLLLGMTIEELEAWEKDIKLPKEFKLNPGVTIKDCKSFVETQIIQIKAHGVNTPAYGRLMEFKKELEN